MKSIWQREERGGWVWRMREQLGGFRIKEVGGGELGGEGRGRLQAGETTSKDSIIACLIRSKASSITWVYGCWDQ